MSSFARLPEPSSRQPGHGGPIDQSKNGGQTAPAAPCRWCRLPGGDGTSGAQRQRSCRTDPGDRPALTRPAKTGGRSARSGTARMGDNDVWPWHLLLR